MTDGQGGEDRSGGYGKPPKSTRFRKGQSGNPRGRPPGRHKEPPYEAVLGRMVTIREDGQERRVTAAEAFLLHMSKRGLEGDGPAARDMLAAFEGAAINPLGRGKSDLQAIDLIIVSPGSVNTALVLLRMARKLDRYRETARMALEPWLVGAALARLGDRQLTVEDQEKVVRATRTPWKVSWPDWWKVRPNKGPAPKKGL